MYLVARVAEEVQLRLIRPQNLAVGSDPLERGEDVLDEIAELDRVVGALPGLECHLDGLRLPP